MLTPGVCAALTAVSSCREYGRDEVEATGCSGIGAKLDEADNRDLTLSGCE